MLTRDFKVKYRARKVTRTLDQASDSCSLTVIAAVADVEAPERRSGFFGPAEIKRKIREKDECASVCTLRHRSTAAITNTLTTTVCKTTTLATPAMVCACL